MRTEAFGPAIIGIGMYVPDRVVPNSHFVEIGLDTSDGKIVELSGIKERRFAAPDETASGMAVHAALQALQVAQVDPGEIDDLIVSTSTPDYPSFPSTANLVQKLIGSDQLSSAFDILAACNGGIQGLRLGADSIRAGSSDTSLIIASEINSRLVDMTDRNTAILFGDGAGAVVMEKVPDPGIFETVIHADGSQYELLYVDGGFIKMNGQEVFRQAIRGMSGVSEEVLAQAKRQHVGGALDLDSVKWVVPHQANVRIMQRVADKLGVDYGKVISNVDRYGNTSSASIFIALSEAYQAGMLQKDDLVLLTAFGAGVNWGAALLEWKIDPPEPSKLDTSGKTMTLYQALA